MFFYFCSWQCLSLSDAFAAAVFFLVVVLFCLFLLLFPFWKTEPRY